MDNFTNPYILFSSLILLSAITSRYFSRKRANPHDLPLPPGPKGHPLIGSLFDFPTYKPWLVYEEWRKKYGDIIHFEVLGTSFIVLGSLKRTNDLFEKRSKNYSDRVRLPMLLELMQWADNFGLLPYGQSWRRRRRSFHEYFHANAVARYRPAQYDEASKLLPRLLETPNNFLHHIRHTFSAIIMKVAYGIQVQDSNDEYISTAEEVAKGGAEAGTPGRFLVDLIPALKYVPSWMPGAEFKRKAAHWRKLIHNAETRPFQHVKEKMKSEEGAVPCLATMMIEKLPEEIHPSYVEKEILAKHTAAVAYFGGADTTTSTIQFFFLAMAMYPEVQKKAQAELDAVVGPNRLPVYSDRSSLPYINAMAKESMRWQIVLPSGVPHMCTHGDVYDGYYIPKGSLIIGNAWSILHDAEVFVEPEEYKPERYMKDGKLDPDARSPNVAAFGYGRRMCPGRYFSDDSLFIIIALVMSVFNIDPPVDEHGNVTKLTPEMTGGALSHPVPYNCRITPRSSAAEALIRLIGEE